jgi:hypothetical protein
LLTFFAVLISVLFVGLYYQFGVAGVLAALATSGLWLIGFFGTVWDKVKDPLTKRLDYLNQHAFTPLAEWCNNTNSWRISMNFDTALKAVEALKAHRTYLTAGLYPKKLLQLAEWADENTREYERLWSDLYTATLKWIQDHPADWVGFSTAPDMPVVISLLGFQQPEFNPNTAERLRPFVKSHRERNGEQLARFVALQKDFENKRSAMLTILKAYMGANMLHKPSTG